MRVTLDRIGNSRGVRLPKAIIEQCGFELGIEMTVRGTEVVLSPAKPIREGWDERFREAAGVEPEAPLLGEFGTDWEDDGWTW